MGLFDAIKLYQTEWVEVKARPFNEDECKLVLADVLVVASKFGKSGCFQFKEGKRYIPFEPTAQVNIGENIPMQNLGIVQLKYTGTDTARQGTQILRIRVMAPTVVESTFDNPFGL